MQAKITELWLEIFYKRPNIEIKKQKNTRKCRKESCSMKNEIMKFEEVMEFISVGKIHCTHS